MDVLLVAFASAAFMAVAGFAFAIGQLVTSRNRLQRRLPAVGARITEALTGEPEELAKQVRADVAEHVRRESLSLNQKELRYSPVRL